MAYREVARVEMQEIIRRWQLGEGHRRIASGTGASRNTVRKYVNAAAAAGFSRNGPTPTPYQISAPTALRQAGLLKSKVTNEELLVPWAGQIYQWLTVIALRLWPQKIAQGKCPSMKDVTLNQREQPRLQVLNSVLEYQLPRPPADEVMGISERQLRRVLATCRREGAAALSHGNRGRMPRNAVAEEVTATVIMLAREKYAGFNHGLPSARRHRPPKHRVRRERMPQEGLLQMDGSHHPWLEERGPRFVLLTGDDATGTVANAFFRPGEDTRGYFQLMEGVIHRYGIPHSNLRRPARGLQVCRKAPAYTSTCRPNPLHPGHAGTGY